VSARILKDTASPRTPAPKRLAYRRVLVPVAGKESEQAVTVACQLAAEHGASVLALAVIEVAAELPLDAHMVDEEAEAKRLLAATQAIGDLYGVNVVPRTIRARAAGVAIVEEAIRAQAEIVVVRASRKERFGRRARIFGKTVDYVLKHAPCRVMITAPPPSP
jgi:basic amino acid/polyamine antiporter, APA family